MKTTKRIFISVFLLLSTAANAQTVTSGAQGFSPTAWIIPFQLIKKLMVVRAFVNGQEGNFIVDTGSESLILNAKYFTGLRNRNDQVRDFAGSGSMFRERFIQFGWQQDHGKWYRAIVTSFGLLEQIMGIQVMGYIGYDQLKNFEVVFDYSQKEITLIPIDRRGRRKGDWPIHLDATDTIPLRSNGHLPYLTVVLGRQKLKLGIDSGASLNLLRADILPKIAAHFRIESTQRTAGFNGKITLSQSGRLENIQVGKGEWPPMQCVVADLSHLNTTLRTPLDGVLGFEFFQQGKIAVNYRLGQMRVWRRDVFLTDVVGSGKK